MNPFKLTPTSIGRVLQIHAPCAALFLLLGATASAQKPAPVAKGYNAFPTIRTRNVFDPERRPILANRDQQATQDRRGSGRTRANFISITGTMVSGNTSLAFFSGSRPEYSKVLGVHEKIADFIITSITAEKVEFDRAGTPISVVVGAQIPLTGSSAAGTSPILDDAGDSTEPAPAAETTTSPSSPSSPRSGVPAAPPAGAAPTGDKAEILRRMMERRQKEI